MTQTMTPTPGPLIAQELDRAPLIAHELDIDDPMAHESRAALQFLRSMSIGKIIAAVGSGTSTIYGYDSWGEFIGELSSFLIGIYETDPQENDSNRCLSEIGQSLCKDVLIPDQKEKNKDNKLSDSERLTICSSIIDSMTRVGTKKYRNKIVDLFSARIVRKWSDFAEDILSQTIKAPLIKLLKIDSTSESYMPPDLCKFLEKLPIKKICFQRSYKKTGKQ